MPESTPFCFVHCADLHLDSPFEGIHNLNPDIAAILRDATFRAFDQVINLALRENADFIIVAGDVYDGADRSLRAQLRFRDGLRKATAAGIACFVAHGNHDPLSGWEAKLEMPAGVQRFGPEMAQPLAATRNGQILAHLYGISYPVRDVRENLAPQFRRQDQGPFAIGVLHCNVGGNRNHDNYAPCTLTDLLDGRMDYWALGHVHAHQVLRQQDPCIIYPGNTQGRNPRETGPRGCYLVRVGASGRATWQFVATDVVRWFVRDLDIAGLSSLDELIEALEQTREEVRGEAEGRAAVLRLSLGGRGAVHGELRRIDPENDLAARLRAGETDRLDFVWVESLQNRTRPPLDLAQRRAVQDFVGDFLQAAEAIRTTENPGGALRQVLSQRPEHRAAARQLEGFSDDDLASMLDEAEALGLDLLLPEDL